MLLRSWFFIFICLFSGHSLADTVWLDNGDRLSGRIELIEGGRLVMATELAGTVTLPVNRIRTLESDRGLLVKTRGQAERALSLRASETPGEVLLVNGAEQPLALEDIQQLMEPRPLIEDWQWSGKALASLDVKEADSDTRDLDLSLDAQARHGDWRHALGYEFERDFRDEVKSRHVWSADYDLSWFFAEKWFWQTSLGYRRDLLSEVARRRQLDLRYLLNSWASLSLIADWDYLSATDGSDINYRRYRLGMGINW